MLNWPFLKPLIRAFKPNLAPQLNHNRFKTYAYTALAMIAFAANSVLCRLALKGDQIDAASFTSVRLLSGIAMFILLSLATRNRSKSVSINWRTDLKPAIYLFTYAVAFSYAYISLDTGVGALILFGSVQLTIIGANLLLGHKISYLEWLGIGLSFIGLTYLVYPTLSTPTVTGFILMAVSGVAWGAYTLKGKAAADPFRSTALNFKLTLPLIAVLTLFSFPSIELSSDGILLATLSGAIASALGYTIWYQVLVGLENSEAAVVQLSVPIIASLGGVLFVNEPLTIELIISALLILGGILLVVISKRR